jgi:UDP-N-acetylmuramyl pentapeptide phosphotransferase/UDP-N-acetylglucosamine-1-phosphate transferase
VLETLLFLACAVLAWALVLGMRRWALRLGLLDVPNERSIHKETTPLGGGAAIVAVTAVGIAVGTAFGTRPEWPAFGGYLAGALLIAAVSLFDDFRALPAAARLAIQFAAAALMILGLVGPPGLVLSPIPIVLGWGIALIWSVGLTNAYNFMDGVDGLAATQGLVAGLGWTALAALNHEPWLSLLGLLLAAGCAGFLVHNWSPAKIFMGDAGSAFLGFTFAFITLAALRRSPQVALVGALMLWPFLFDTLFTMIRRAKRGENLLVAHRSHLYQRLVLAGWRHASVTVLYGFLSLITLSIGVAWLLTATVTSAFFLIATSLLLPLALWLLVIRAERQVSRTPSQTPYKA